MDYIADEYELNHERTGVRVKNAVKKDLRRGLKTIKKGVRQGKKTIRRGVRNASKLFDSSKPSAASENSTAPAESESGQNVEFEQEEVEFEQEEAQPSSEEECDITVPEEGSENQVPDFLPQGNFQEAETDKVCFSGPFGVVMSSGRAPEDLKPGSVEYFQKWIQTLESSLVAPDLDLELWNETLQGYQKSKDTLDEAQKALDEAKKLPEPDQAIIDSLTQAVENANQELNDALENTQTIADSLLHTPEFQSFLQPNDFGDDDWVTWRVLKSTSPKQWAQWCCQEETNRQQPMLDLIVSMLQSTDFLREILQEGDGPRGNNYCNFLKLWQELCPQENPVLRRLAMAIALEFAAEDYNIFGTKDKIDPIERYIHYEQAYLGGELDPAFCTFGVWELRMVVNSDASNDQLSWGRSCLINYRPDLILWDNDQWRYNFIVKSDVAPKNPDWYKQPNSYDQILSGGGKCGPRAWYGRFICKAFGIPTWGTRQTGHAAMSRWTPKGWVICLGAGWPWCYWEGRAGVDFKLESDARMACSSSAEYRQLVQRLQWIVMRKGEKETNVRANEPSPSCPWASLAMLQSKIISSRTRQTILGDATNRSPCPPAADEKVILSKIQRMKNQGTPVPGSAHFDPDTNTLILPADCCSHPTQSTNKVHFHPCFRGGRQIFLQGDGVIEYTLTPLFPKSNGPKQYKLSLCVCTVHRAETDMRVTVSEPGSGNKEYAVALPYTMGEWQYTEPVTIELSGGLYPMLSFQRSFQGFGISLKEIKISSA